MNVDHFQQYDYGSDSANRAVYGTTTIPKIPIENIKKVPIAYFVGLHDDLADPTDAQHSYDQIPTVIKYNQYNDMDHYSFMVGKDMSYTQDVLSLAAQYNPQTAESEDPVKKSLY